MNIIEVMNLPVGSRVKIKNDPFMFDNLFEVGYAELRRVTDKEDITEIYNLNYIVNHEFEEVVSKVKLEDVLKQENLGKIVEVYINGKQVLDGYTFHVVKKEGLNNVVHYDLASQEYDVYLADMYYLSELLNAEYIIRGDYCG